MEVRNWRGLKLEVFSGWRDGLNGAQLGKIIYKIDADKNWSIYMSYPALSDFWKRTIYKENSLSR